MFGQVMGLVARAVGWAALGAYVGRNLSGGARLRFFIGAFARIFGLNIASTRGREQPFSIVSSVAGDRGRSLFTFRDG